MHSKSKVDKSHQLQNQINSSSILGNIAEGDHPLIGINVPDEQPGEECKEHKENTKEHVVEERPQPSKEELDEIGHTESKASSVYNFNTVETKDLIQVGVNNLLILQSSKTEILYHCLAHTG